MPTASYDGDPDAKSSGMPLSTGEYAAILDTLSVGVLYGDADGNVRYVNDALCRLFNLSGPGDLTGTQVDEALERLRGPAQAGQTTPDANPVSGSVWRLASGETVEASQVAAGDGPLGGILWQFRALAAKESSAVQAQGADLWQHTEPALRRHNEFLEMLHQTTLGLVNRLDLDDLLQSIVERAASLLGSVHGYIYLIEPDDMSIVVRYACGLFRQYIGFSMKRGEGIAGKAWASGAPLVVDDYDRWAGRSQSWAENLIHAVACVPLLARGQVVGVIGVSKLEASHSFQADEVSLLSRFSELASLALENARLYRSAQDEIDERRRTEAALRESEARYRSVITAMGEGIILVNADGIIADLNATAERILSVARSRLVGQDISMFADLLIRQDGTAFTPREYPARITLATGAPQNDVIMGVRRQDGGTTWLSVNAQPITGPEHQVTSVVISFSNITEHRQMQDELQRRIDMLATLQQMDVELSKSLDVDYVLRTSLELTIGAASVRDGFIVLHEESQPPSIHSQSDTLDPATILAYWQASGDWARILAARAPLLLDCDGATCIAVPLASAEHQVGLLVLALEQEQAAPDTLALLDLIGSHIGLAVENARLFQVSQGQLAELQDVYVQLKRLEELKTQMIQVAAHDIRSPLGIISGYATLLRDDLSEASAPYDMYFDAIFRAVERLEHMTSDILSLERIHATDEGAYERFSLDEIVRRAADEYHAHAQVKGVEYEVDVDDRPFTVRGDAIQIYEAIANLISNAIKYTLPGGRVGVHWHHDGTHARFEVTDTGIGIPLESQALLFQPFYRVKNDDTRLIDGTGLGLYLVKNIVDGHSGTMYFESEAGRGSTFGFDLPAAPPLQMETAGPQN